MEDNPPRVTTTGPVVAPEGTGTAMLVEPQTVGVATVPLNVTVLVPCVEPKFVPVIVIGVPTFPTFVLSCVIVGMDPTTKTTPLLANPPEVVTITLPVVAPVGTGATSMFELQLVGIAAVPLKVTVLDPIEDPKLLPVMVTEVPTGP